MLRTVLAIVALQFSGLPHVLVDLVEVVSATPSIEHHDCDDDGPAGECPPGCMDCHRGHATILPADYVADLFAALGRIPGSELATIHLDQTSPTSAHAPSVFRPPRSHC